MQTKIFQPVFMFSVSKRVFLTLGTKTMGGNSLSSLIASQANNEHCKNMYYGLPFQLQCSKDTCDMLRFDEARQHTLLTKLTKENSL